MKHWVWLPLMVFASTFTLFGGLGKMQTADDRELLSLRLYLPESSVCAGTADLGVEMELLNKSGSEVTVSSRGFGPAIDFIALYNSADGHARLESFQTVGDRFSSAKKSTVALKPGESLRASGAVNMKDEFFHTPGFYKVRLGYSGDMSIKTGRQKPFTSSSNWAIFEMRACEP